MKRTFWKSSAVIAALMATSIPITKVQAQGLTESGFGIGAVIGNPTGISLSLPVGADNAFDILVGYDLNTNPNITLLGDYVWHRRDLITIDQGKMSLYYGPGVRAVIGREAEIGVRVVLGIDYIFPDMPLQALLEVGPGINILPQTDPNGTVGLGLRYYF